mmetsp:Transcript_24063/g.81129  ORF Transcript_24063/g.81129 Transcript_24063/m.81129 type:complete len:203 (-) Transcript_24063:178-786(-)
MFAMFWQVKCAILLGASLAARAKNAHASSPIFAAPQLAFARHCGLHSSASSNMFEAALSRSLAMRGFEDKSKSRLRLPSLCKHVAKFTALNSQPRYSKMERTSSGVCALPMCLFVTMAFFVAGDRTGGCAGLNGCAAAPFKRTFILKPFHSMPCMAFTAVSASAGAMLTKQKGFGYPVTGSLGILTSKKLQNGEIMARTSSA